MGQVVETAAVVAFLGGLMFLLYVIIRYSIVSPAKTKASKERLRHPETEGIDAIAGFAPSPDLIAFYKEVGFVESVEFYLVDRSKESPVIWPIGAFSPITARDVREKRKISGVGGIPIADDLDKGMYYIGRSGAVFLHSPNVPGGEVQVAPSIESLAGFEPRDKPPGQA